MRTRKYLTPLLMKRPIHITAARKDPPDLDRFVAALLALAIARVEAEQEEARSAPPEAAPEGDHE